jgi:hypothetical protein
VVWKENKEEGNTQEKAYLNAFNVEANNGWGENAR